MSNISLNEKNKGNVREFFEQIYHEQPSRDEALSKFIQIINADLSDREYRVIVMRHGFIDNKPKTLLETAQCFGTSREKIRQVESKAIKKLLHPTRRKLLI